MDDLIERIFQRSLFELGDQPITLLWIIKLLAALIFISVITTIIKRFLKHRLLVRLSIDAGNREAISTLVSFVIGAVGYLIVLQATGIDLSSLAVIVGGLGVGIGFGLQDITKNLLSGLTVLIERKLRVGDFIEFGDIAGYIDEISIRSTVIRTLEGAEVMIPNSQLAEERITNWSYRSFSGRQEIEVGVAYGSDPVLVTETLLEAAYSNPDVLREPSPKVIFVGFGDSSLDFKLWIWVNRVDRRAYIRSNLTFAIEYLLRQREITIPFPQMDLWMKTPVTYGLAEEEQAPDQTSPPSQQIAAPANNKMPVHQGKTLRSQLAQISYFHDLNELQLRDLIEIGFRQQVEVHTLWKQPGDAVNEFCIILSGAVGVFHKSEHMVTLKPGEFFGELPLILDIPSPLTLKMEEATELFVIGKANFEKLLKDYPVFSQEIVRESSSRREYLRAHPEIMQSMETSTEAENNPMVWIRQRLRELFPKPFV